jgi:hypothetical protein
MPIAPLLILAIRGIAPMSYRNREDGSRPKIDLNDDSSARKELQQLVDSAGLRNIVIALARLTSDRAESFQGKDPILAACWSQSATALFRCDLKLDALWPPSQEFRDSIARSKNAERIGSSLAQTVKKLFR